MAKALLVVDTDDCAGCPAAIYDEIDGYSMCQAMRLKDIPDHFSKPDWCPLIPEPERAEYETHLDSDDYDPDDVNSWELGQLLEEEYADGWNDCIDYLEGKT